MNANEKRVSTNLQIYNVQNVSQLPKTQEKRREAFAAKRNGLTYKRVPALNKIVADDFRLYVLKKEIADEWLNKYHPLNAPRGNILSLGLVKDNVIYCIMTFKKSRNKKYYAELSRMWTLPSYEIIGGYDKLSQYASEIGLSNIVAYVSKTFERLDEYSKIGMTPVRELQRTKWWTNFKDIMSDASRRQKKISEQVLLDSGWIFLYDEGCVVFEYSSL